VKTCLLFSINNQSKALVIVLLKIEYWKNLIACSICFLCFGTFVEMLKARWGRIKASEYLVQNLGWKPKMADNNKTAFDLYKLA